MPLARLPRRTAPAVDPDPRRAALARRPVAQLAARRRDRQRRRVRVRLVPGGRRAPTASRPRSTASSRRGTTRTCARSRGRCAARCSSATSARPAARRSSRRTATRSATRTGCSCTTASSADFAKVKRDLTFAIDPSLYPHVRGTTDSEVLFHLALTFGLRDDPVRAMTETVQLVESVGHEHGVRFPMQGTIAVSDGTTLWTFRYSTQGRSRSLFHSVDIPTIREMYPDAERLVALRTTTRTSWSRSRSTTCPAPSWRCPRRPSRSSTPTGTGTSRSWRDAPARAQPRGCSVTRR